MAHFLTPLLDHPNDRFQLVNATTGAVIATTLLTAFDSASRRTGLLKHTGLPPDTALIIAPCNAVHTFFMKFAIDVVFVARDGRVLKVRRSLGAWRIGASLTAFAAIEMCAGMTKSALAKGDVVRLTHPSGGH